VRAPVKWLPAGIGVAGVLTVVAVVAYDGLNSAHGKSSNNHSHAAVHSPRQAPLQTPYGPEDVVLNQTGTIAYVTSDRPRYGLITEINLRSDTAVRAIRIAGDAGNVALSRDGDFAYVISSPPGARTGLLTVVDLSNGRAVRRLPAGPSPESVVASTAAPVVLVQGTDDFSDIRQGSDAGPDVLTLLNVTTGAARRLPGLGGRPLLFTLGASRNTAYVQDDTTETLKAIALATGGIRSVGGTLGNALTRLGSTAACASSLNALQTHLKLWTINTVTGARELSGTITEPLGASQNGPVLEACAPNGSAAYVSGLQSANAGTTANEPTISRYIFSAQILEPAIDLADIDDVHNRLTNPGDPGTYIEQFVFPPTRKLGYALMSVDDAHPDGFLEPVDFAAGQAGSPISLG
jgi:hypothetical protein